MKLQNYTEIAVKNYIDQLQQKTDMCRCEACILDIMAISLNKLKPCYIVTEKGALFAQLNEFAAQYKIDIMTAVAQAAKTVKDNPRHEDSRPSASL